MQNLKIATRKSLLALWQSEFVKSELLKLDSNLNIELLEFTTKGDKLLDSPLAKIGGKGLFVKELEQALLAGEADLAVHSLKDVPMQLPLGLELACVLKRHSPFDAFVSNEYQNIEEMPVGALVGTSSLRRASQLKRKYPHLEFINLRGNIHTRLAKLDAGEYSAIILAASGLERMGFGARIKQIFDEETCLPACGQGALAVEIRGDNLELKQLLQKLICKKTFLEVACERAFNKGLNGGCQVPIAGFAVIENDEIRLKSKLLSLDGKEVFAENLVSNLKGDFESEEFFAENMQIAENLGRLSAELFLAKGAGEILQAIDLLNKDANANGSNAD